MNDIRIVHDRCGVYADWFCCHPIHDNELIPFLRQHDYFIGKSKPNYPVPAIDHYKGFNAFEWNCVPCGYFTLKYGTSWRRNT